MAEMLIQSESLTSIADKIRVLSGTEDTMSLDAMESHVDEANTDVATEAGLIAQIVSALEGKAGGGHTGSAMQFATGRFVPTSSDISTNPVTVSGLNFEPKSIAIALYGTTAISYIPTSGSYLMALATGELFDDYSLIMKKAISSGGVQQSDVFSVELAQDGFILKSTTTTDGMLMLQYVYYAFG